jgi:hypothetical protein
MQIQGLVGFSGSGSSSRRTLLVERLLVGYADTSVLVFDRAIREERPLHVFVAVLGSSNYTYTEACWSKGLADSTGAHVNALMFLGEVPKPLVCDNLHSEVTAACRYAPGINRTYQEMAAHYSTAVLPIVSAIHAIWPSRTRGADRRAIHPGAAARPTAPVARRT